MAQKRKIRIVNKTKLFSSAAILLLAIVLLVTFVSSLSGDKIEKQIEKLEDQKITILDRRFECSIKNSTTVELGDTISFKLVYYYQTDDSSIRSHSVTEDVEVSIKGVTEDNPSKSASVNGNSLTILNTATAGDEVEVILSHKCVEDATFTFVVNDSEYVE